MLKLFAASLSISRQQLLRRVQVASMATEIVAATKWKEGDK